MQHQEIVDIACKTLSTLNERTVRTALQRMKGAGELYVTDNRWYVTRRQKPQSAGA
jgi:DNA-binding transcriptional regulator PaaX